MKIAKEHNLKVVEDAAQGFMAKYKDKYLGTIGDIDLDKIVVYILFFLFSLLHPLFSSFHMD